MSKSQSGYTLVELLCVTAILGVLTLTFWGVAGSSTDHVSAKLLVAAAASLVGDLWIQAIPAD